MFIVGNPAYPSYQVLLAAGVAAVITAVVMPFFIKLMRHEGACPCSRWGPTVPSDTS